MQVQKNEQGIYNFDTLVITPVICELGGERADVSMIPIAVTLALSIRADMSKEEMLAEAEADGEASLRKTLQLVSDVCVISNAKFTVDFLMKHLGGPKLNAFVEFVLMPMKAKAAKFLEAGEGNAPTDEAQSD